MKLDQYEILPPLETFSESLGHYFPNEEIQKKIMKRILNMLSFRPRHYEMFEGPKEIRGARFAGLRHIKVGVSGIKGGAVAWFRICEECKKNNYHSISGVKCNFCDNQKGKHIVLFLVHPRGLDYD